LLLNYFAVKKQLDKNAPISFMASSSTSNFSPEEAVVKPVRKKKKPKK